MGSWRSTGTFCASIPWTLGGGKGCPSAGGGLTHQKVPVSACPPGSCAEMVLPLLPSQACGASRSHQFTGCGLGAVSLVPGLQKVDGLDLGQHGLQNVWSEPSVSSPELDRSSRLLGRPPCSHTCAALSRCRRRGAWSVTPGPPSVLASTGVSPGCWGD